MSDAKLANHLGFSGRNSKRLGRCAGLLLRIGFIVLICDDMMPPNPAVIPIQDSMVELLRRGEVLAGSLCSILMF